MIVKCDTCQTKFRIDDSKVTEKGVRVRCTKCSSIFFIEPQIPEPIREPQRVEPTRVEPPKIEPPKEEPQRAEPPKEEPPLSFDIEDKTDIFETDKKEISDNERLAKEWEMDISFGEEKLSPAKEESETGGGGFEIFEDSSHLDKTLDKGFSFEIEKTPLEEHTEEPSTTLEDKPIPAEHKIITDEEVHPSFEGQGSDTSHEKTFFDDVITDVQEEKEKSHSWIIIVLGIMFVVLSGGIFYITGGINTVAKILSMKDAPSTGKVDIIDLKGYYYTENIALGRLFVIEGKVMSSHNISKDVVGIKGILYNSKGGIIEEKLVSPGVIILADDLKTISGEGLGKLFKNTKKSVLPAKGSMPFMVIFSDIPPDTHEFGVELIM